MDDLTQTLQSTRGALMPNQRGPVPAAPSYFGDRYGMEGASEDDAGSALMEYWRVLRRNASTIAIASIAGAILGFSVGIPMKPVYRARTSLEILTINDDFMNMKQSTPTTTNENSYDTSEEQTQAKLLESEALRDRVIKKLQPVGGMIRPAGTRIAKEGWRSILHLSEPAAQTPRDKLISQAASTIKVRSTAHTRVLEVTVDCTDPELAVTFANTMTEEFMAQNLQARWDATQRTSDWLRRELDDARDRLRHSEDALQAYARSSGLIFTDETNNVATEKLQQVQQALSIATTERIAHQSRYELAQSSPPESLADVLNDASLRETQSKISDLKRQIADLSTVFNPEYSKIQRLQAELESLEASSSRSSANILSRIKNDYRESNRKEKLLAAAYDTQAQNVTGQDEKAIQYNILKRDVDSNRQLYDTMLQQMKQASIASAMRASNVRVVDPAKIPESAVSPNFKFNSALGLIAGLLLSIAAVSIRDKADRSLQQPGDVKLWLDLPELGTIPSSAMESRGYLYNSVQDGDGQDESEGHLIGPGGRMRRAGLTALSSAVELVTFQKKPSLMAEAFRSTLTSILFVGENGNRPRVLLFTSANAADGKTTVASNLAIAAADIRCKVLVIDADLRRPRMHQIFNVENERGLTTLLHGDLDENRLAELVTPTRVPNLHVLAAGPPSHAAAHLLYSPNFGTIMSKLRLDYDLIIIDSPPMLQMTDARVIGRLSDAVVLVARAGRTTRDALVAAKDRFAEDRIRVLGTILNDWNPKIAPGGYYGSYRQSTYTSSYKST